MKSWHHPVLNCADSKVFEEQLFADEPSLAAKAMEQAGRALGAQILKDLGAENRLRGEAKGLLIIGKGHNTGDAVIAAIELLNALPELRFDLLPVLGMDGFSSNVQPWLDTLLEYDSRVRLVDRSDIVEHASQAWDLSIDGVFGMQFRTPLSVALSTCFSRINDLSIGVRIAVDLPSGLGDTIANEVLRADFTYATGILKKPLFMEENAAFCGRIRYLDIGFFDDEEIDTGDRVANHELLFAQKKLRPVLSDKRDYGHLLIVGGSRMMPGALLMAVQAAVRSGVGLITVVGPESRVAHMAPHAPEAMWVPWSETETGGLALEGMSALYAFENKITAVLMGPGCGSDPETQALLDAVVELFEVPTILDADALTRERVCKLQSIDHRPIVLTPHRGELMRVLGVRSEASMTRSALEGFADGFANLALVLKAPHTRLFDGEKIILFPTGNPMLARGGSGDILAGLIAGKVAKSNDHHFLQSVAEGIYCHGSAADRTFACNEETNICTTEILNHLNVL